MKNVKYINAGAGSGKTWTLSHMLSEALVEKDVLKRVVPSQVIVYPAEPLLAQRQEVRSYQLYNIITSESGQQ